MKKHLFFLVLTMFLFFSCQKGDIGPAGETGQKGADGESYLAAQFQDGVFPDTAYSGTYDTRIINSDLSNRNYGNCFNLEIGYYNNRIYRVLIKFNLSSIPETAIVKSAYLTMFCYQVSIGGTINLAAYKITKNWTEGSGNCGGFVDVNASWDYYDGLTNSWGTPGGDFDLSTQSEIKNISTAGYWTIKLNNQMVQDWISNPSNNYGMIIKSIDETTGYTANYDKTRNPKELRPKLTIYYTLP